MKNDHLPPACLPETLVEAIEKAEVISFDIFDTALIRTTEKPVDIFMLLAYEAGIEDPLAFTAARMQAEAEARNLAWESRGATEITLAEIYAQLLERTPFSAQFVSDLMRQERDLELRLCRRHPVIGQAFDWALKLNKKVGFISDMYLDTPLIEAMLLKCGYKAFDFLWVSAETGTTKASGGLYRHVQEQLKTSALTQLHIGDNVDSDIIQARAAGLTAYHIGKNAERLPDTPLGKRFSRQKITPVAPEQSALAEQDSGIWKSLWRGLVAAHQAKNEDDFWYMLGYTHVGMLLLGFSLWLHRQARHDGVTQLYFLARDGHIMREAYQLVDDHSLTQCPGRYLYASRRALNVPALTEINEQACDFLVSGTTRMPVGAFLSRVGLAIPDALPMIQAVGFSGPEQMVLSGEDYGKLRALFRALSPLILPQAEKERDLLCQYLQQEHVFEHSHIGLVDIGWHGSLQDSFCNLLSLLGKNNKVTGFYLGTFPAARARVAKGAKQHAYLCEGGEPVKHWNIILASVEVFEWLFCAPHGSVLGFERHNDKIMPLLESGEQEKIRITTATQMQAGALQFMQDALSCFVPGTTLPAISSDLAIALLDDLLHHPTPQEAKLLGDLPHAEGFGDIVQVQSLARPTHKPYNIFRWRKLVDGYRTAFWRTGYKRRLWPDCW